MNVPPTSMPMRKPTIGYAAPPLDFAQRLGGFVIDRERVVLEAAREHDAVVALRRFERDELVEHVVEHDLRIALERIAPAAAAAVDVAERLARRVRARRSPCT